MGVRLAQILLFLLLLSTGCGKQEVPHHSHLVEGALPDTLRVATLYSPTSYFLYREQPMGYDYGLVKRFTDDKNLKLELVVAPSLASMMEMLDSGKVDLLAYKIPVTSEYRKRVVHCGPESETHQVLVQPRRAKKKLIADVTELVDKDVYVEADSKYYYRLQNLNEELGGGINICAIDRDTLITEDLIEMVSNGQIPLTVVDNDIAQVNKTYFPNLDVSLALSFPQRSTWAVDARHSWLGDSINEWLNEEKPRATQERLLRRYFELSKGKGSVTTEDKIDFSDGTISPFDPIFKKYANAINYDWRLFASQGYVESRFDTTKVSWAGARGIMQIMPPTAVAYGTTAEEIVSPEAAIKTASLILSDLDRNLTKSVPDSNERWKFVLAAYNAGLAHVFDAIALARKYGFTPDVWDDNVAECMIMKSNPEYYNDPVCRFGYARGKETVDYVNNVVEFYTRCKQYIT
ncbi:MAG: transporter substrate-binding domain-containing protein [Muribaculaceae bacterium]|nr:transporter substrate-binding domain-containing protein [Muribaculaceae bacterium]